MKEVQSVLQDPIGTAPQKGDSKIKKYVRIVIGCIGLAFFALVIVAAAMRKFGG
jgi:hypothetical protein